MDAIDCNLLAAWNRVGRIVRRDRIEAQKRFRRRFTPALTRPMRAWCLCIRASDTRISPFSCEIDLDPDVTANLGETVESLVAGGAAHTVYMDGRAIRKLTKPVDIDWPGVPTWEAARIIGMSKDLTRRWMEKGYLKLERYDPPRCHGKLGNPIPIVYTPSPIDPNNFHGRPPEQLWGTLWQTNYQKLPENFLQPIQRVVRLRPLNGRNVMRGWDWICPGLPLGVGRGSRDVDGECGRRCKYLYAPLPVWTLGQSTVVDLSLPMPVDSGLVGEWHPGSHEPLVGEGNRRFACKVCWGVRNTSLVDHCGWNEFITHISGGLLYGHEVERPLDEAPKRRKRKPYSTTPRPATVHRRREIVDGLLSGLTYQQIADRLGIAFHIVQYHIKKMYRENGVHNRGQLCGLYEAERSDLAVGG